MVRLKQRADFLAAASGGTKIATTGFVLQRRRRDDGGPARIGFTVSRKVGTAVERNRVRRRLREMVRLAGDLEGGCDYVLIGRRPALARPFDRLGTDLRHALARMSQQRDPADAGTPPRRGRGPSRPDATRSMSRTDKPR